MCPDGRVSDPPLRDSAVAGYIRGVYVPLTIFPWLQKSPVLQSIWNKKPSINTSERHR